jgi:hypothetical protein
MRPVLALSLFILLVCSCGTTRVITVPVETVREVQVMNHTRDSIYLYDSIREIIKNDTVRIMSYRYLYRDKIVRDTVLRCDSIPVTVEVQVPGPVTNELTGWQSFQLWCGRGLLAVLALYFVVVLLKKKFGL